MAKAKKPNKNAKALKVSQVLGAKDLPKALADMSAESKIGRPTAYTEELAKAICDLISQGYTLLDINREGREFGLPAMSTIMQWLHQHELFVENYRRAQETRMWAMAEEIQALSDQTTPENHHVKRLQIQTRQWLMSKLGYKTFGDRIGLDVGAGGGSVVFAWQGEAKPAVQGQPTNQPPMIDVTPNKDKP